MRIRSLILILLLFINSILIGQFQEKNIDIYDLSNSEFLKTDLQKLEIEAYEYYQVKEYEAAAEVYLKLLRHNITDAGNIYNLACCYGLLGKSDLAAHYLLLSYNSGFKELDHIISDPDFENVKEDPPFSGIIDSLKTIAELKTAENYLLVSTSSFQKFKIKIPGNYDPSLSYPLVIGLHGLGDNQDNFFNLGKDFTKFFFAVPQAPYPYRFGNDLGYSWNIRNIEDAELENLSWLKSAEFVKDMIDKIKGEYSISNVYIFGFSQGGFLSYLSGLKFHQNIKAIAPFGGWFPDYILSEDEIQSASDLEVFIGHGKEDNAVMFSDAEYSLKLLTEYGFMVEKDFYEGGHRIDRETLSRAIKWMMRNEGTFEEDE